MSRFHEEMRAGSTTGRSSSAWHLGQHTNPIRAERRRQIATVGGIRKFKRVQRALREDCRA